MEADAATAAVRFDWETKWLKGEEYAFMLRHVSKYERDFGMQVYPSRTHPSAIYSDPRNGFVYFIKGSSVGSEFGFPRVEKKKKFRWKKMNFTTELPKSDPVVVYVVATAMKSCSKSSDSALFRMHAVVLTSASCDPHILCHIRSLAEEDTASSVKSDRESLSAYSPEPQKRRKVARGNGLLALLQAAEEDTSDKENWDYVSLYTCASLRKFPLLGGRPRPVFVVSQK